MKTITADRLVPLLSVSDIERTVAYYVDGLGFEMKSEWIKDGKLRWSMLQYPGGAALMVQEYDPGKGPEGKPGAGVTMYVMCDDAVAFHEQVTQRGVEANEPFIGNGMHVVELTDPDGFRISFESPTSGASG